MNVYSRTKRLREFLVWFVERYKPRCWVCHERITLEQVGRSCDDLILHHADEDRSHNKNANLELLHKGCHRYHHWRVKAVAKGMKGIPTKPTLCPKCRRRIVEDLKREFCRECRKEARYSGKRALVRAVNAALGKEK